MKTKMTRIIFSFLSVMALAACGSRNAGTRGNRRKYKDAFDQLTRMEEMYRSYANSEG